MKNFEYVITDEMGIHARPAGQLVKEAARYKSLITITSGEKSVEAKKLLGIMSMGIRNGHTITVTIEGEDEEIALEGMKKFFQENL
jgi:phosphocarrier protein